MTPFLKTNRIEDAIVTFQLIFVVFIGHVCSTYAVLPPYGLPTYRRDEFLSQGSVPKYKYSYNVQNVEGGQHGHRVFMNGQRTSGKYYVKLNGGTTQDVEYYTDRFGYHPKVSYQNNLDSSGSSVARVVFGSYTPYNFTNFLPETNRSTSNAITSENNTTSAIPRSTTSFSFDKDNLTTENTNETFPNVNVPTLNNSDSINVDASNATSSHEIVDPGTDPILYASDIPTVFVPPLSQAPTLVFASQANIPATIDSSDVYLHPEMNEIAKGLALNKLESIASRIKLIKPIIVTDASIDDGASVSKSDQIVESNQPRVYASDASNRTKEQETSTAHTTNATSASIHDHFADEKPKTIVDIEPQTVEEKAVITTTIDIAKSLPVAENLVQEVDNHLNEGPLSSEPTYRVPNVQLPLTPQVPSFFGHFRHPLVAHPYVYSPIGHYPLSPGRIPHLQPTITPTFQYIPIPVFQHQPNPIPLNNQNYAASPLPFNVTHLASVSNEDSKTSNSDVKAKRAPIQASQTHFPRETSFAKDDYRRPTYSSGFGHNQHSKSFGNQPHHFVAKYQDRAYATGAGGYNTKLFSKEARKAPKLAPFKPSHPLWDSIYPPQHMYYIPYYVVDKIPGDRKTRESFRNHRRLRRLFVEYGGFKPPLIPSTLLEIEDTSDKTEVPKETVKYTNT